MLFTRGIILLDSSIILYKSRWFPLICLNTWTFYQLCDDTPEPPVPHEKCGTGGLGVSSGMKLFPSL